MNRDRDPAELMISRVIPVDRAPSELARGVVLTLHADSQREGDLERLQYAVRQTSGGLELYLELLGLSGIRHALFKAGPNYRVRYDAAVRKTLEEIVGVGNVRPYGPGGLAPQTAPVLAPVATESPAEFDGLADDPDEI